MTLKKFNSRQEFVSLSDIEAAEKETPPFGPIGNIVDNRTYRRWLPEKGRRESFARRNARSINYNLGLVEDKVSYLELKEEAQLYFRFLNQLKVWPSSRTQWIGGTETCFKEPAANFNCSATAINRPTAFRDVANLLMLGVGVGFRVHSKDVNQLPPITQSPELVIEEYTPLEKNDRQEDTTIVSVGEEVFVTVGDSRFGWCDAIQILINSFFGIEGWNGVKKISYNFNSIRPMGERLRGFGGTASGPQALMDIIKNIHRIFKEVPGNKLRSVDCMDICCASAKGIIAGSSRRSALICLFEHGDLLCRNAKLGLYSNPDLAHKSYRAQSNNTENVGSIHEKEVLKFAVNNPDLHIDHPKVKAFLMSLRPDRAYFEELFKTIPSEGEPGFDNFPRMQLLRFYAARKREPEISPVTLWDMYCDVLTNPCHEILLNTGVNDSVSVSFCNLTTIPLPNHVSVSPEGVKYVDYESLETAIRLTVRIGLRQTEVDIPYWNMSECQLLERLLGQSLTGYRDFLDLLGWQTGSEEVKAFLSQLKEWANDEATVYSRRLGVPRPLLVTTVKPEGTFSKVAGVSNGLHWDRNEYYIQRMRCSASDALALTLRKQGIPCYPEVYDLERMTGLGDGDIFSRIKQFDLLSPEERDERLNTCETLVFEFPIKSISKTSSASVSAVEQLENMKDLTLYYTDHMPSSTINVKSEEWESCINWVMDNWSEYTTASFLSYFASSYPLLPWEDIDEEEYNRRVENISSQYRAVDSFGRSFFLLDEDLLASFERQIEGMPEDTAMDESITSCGLAGGGCPIR